MRDTPDPAAQRGFAAWIAADATHQAAYDQVSKAHGRVASLAQEPALLALRQEALARATLMPPRRRFRKRSVAAGFFLFATAAPLAAWTIGRWLLVPAPAPFEESFRTAIGQQADVTLPDGSTVRLDTNSHLRVVFTGKQREVLLDGQGWFDVKAADRPFVIKAAERSFAAGNPAAIDGVIASIAAIDQWAGANIDKAAEELAPAVGIPAPVLKRALERQAWGVKPITPEVLAAQQKIADTFRGLGLVPKDIRVADATLPKP